MSTTNLRQIGMLLLTASAVACEQTPVQLPEATSLIVTPERLELTAGDLATATAQVLDQNGRVLRGAAVSWSSNAPGVGRITPDGLVTAVAPGTATMSATYGSLAAQLTVAVARDERDFLAQLELNRTTLTADRRAGVQFVGYRAFDGRGRPRCDVPLEFSVSDRSVVSANQATGCRIVVTPIGPGQTTITAANAGVTASLAVSITFGGEIAFFSGLPDAAELTAGNAVGYQVRLLDANSEPIANHRVNFDVSIGTIATASTTTDDQGYASVEWRLPRILRQQTNSGAYDWGAITFRTQLAGGRVHTEDDTRQIVPGPAAVVVAGAGFNSSGVFVLRTAASGTIQVPLHTSVLLYAEGKDEYGNRRHPEFVRFWLDEQPVATQWYWDWTSGRNYRGVMRYENVPRTLRLLASDGDAAADVAVEFTTGS